MRRPERALEAGIIIWHPVLAFCNFSFPLMGSSSSVMVTIFRIENSNTRSKETTNATKMNSNGQSKGYQAVDKLRYLSGNTNETNANSNVRTVGQTLIMYFSRLQK